MATETAFALARHPDRPAQVRSAAVGVFYVRCGFADGIDRAESAQSASILDRVTYLAFALDELLFSSRAAELAFVS